MTVLAAMTASAVHPGAFADELPPDPDETTTSSVPPESTTSSAPPATTTTTLVPAPPATLPVAPDPVDNHHEEHPDEAPDASDVIVPPEPPDRPATSLDPALLEAFRSAAEAAAEDLYVAEAAVSTAQRQLDDAEAALISVKARIGQLAAREQETIEQLVVTTALLRQRAVKSFVYQGSDAELVPLLGAGSAQELARRQVLVQVVMENDLDLIDTYDQLRRQLGTELAEAADELVDAEAAVIKYAEQVDIASEVLASAEFRAKLLSPDAIGGAALGFVFPVAGPHKFINDWGFPRSGGRSHQGTDIFASKGTPVVAVERGVVYRIGQNSLGGNILWLRGASGTSYYYAHLDGYANVTEGQLVRPGQLLGYVGNTGNAITTPPHLHFQVHPGGGAPVNPFPLLRSVSDAQEQAAVLAAQARGIDLDRSKPAQG